MIIEIRLWAEANPGTSNFAMAASFIIHSNSLFIYYPTIHGGDLGVDGWIILGWISRRWDVGIWTGLGCPRIQTGGGRL